MEPLTFQQVVKLQKNICMFATRLDLEQIENIIKDDSLTIDPTTFTEQELVNLGFSVWSDDALGKLYLIPAWMYNFLLDGVEFTDINLVNEVFKKGETDRDTRYGCLAFGVVIGKK